MIIKGYVPEQFSSKIHAYQEINGRVVSNKSLCGKRLKSGYVIKVNSDVTCEKCSEILNKHNDRKGKNNEQN